MRFISNFVQKKSGIAFDIGANVGHNTQILLDIGFEKVICVEPNPMCVNKLQRRFGNNLNVIIVESACGGHVGDVNIRFCDTPTISSYSNKWIDAVKSDRFKTYSWGDPKRVRMTTIDQLCEQYSIPDFVKIDVEGYELSVLNGMNEYEIPCLSFEYTLPECMDEAKKCIINCIVSGYREFNYCIGQENHLQKSKWLNGIEMGDCIAAHSMGRNGDIYVRRG